MRKAADCTTMEELRAGIDRIDAAIVALLAERAAHIDRAAEIKAAVGLPARIEARVEAVVARVQAAARGLPPDLAEDLWRRLIEWSIAREERALGQPSGQQEAGES